MSAVIMIDDRVKQDCCIDVGSGNLSYMELRKRDIKKIKKLLKENPGTKIYYGNGWIRLCGETFNGFTKEFVKEMLK